MTETPQSNQASTTNSSKSAPIERFSDGNINAKIWRNYSKEGKPFYVVAFSRIYKHPETGKPAETQTFSGTDVLKVQRLAAQAYHAVDRLRKQDRAQAKEQKQAQAQDHTGQAQTLPEQRDQLMGGNAGPQPSQGAHYGPQTPEIER